MGFQLQAQSRRNAIHEMRNVQMHLHTAFDELATDEPLLAAIELDEVARLAARASGHLRQYVKHEAC